MDRKETSPACCRLVLGRWRKSRTPHHAEKLSKESTYPCPIESSRSPPPVTMPFCLSLGGVEGEGRVQRVHHVRGGVAKQMPNLSLLLFPLL